MTAIDTSPEAVGRVATCSRCSCAIHEGDSFHIADGKCCHSLEGCVRALSGELATKEQERLRAETLNGDMVIRIAAVERVLAATEAEVAALKAMLEKCILRLDVAGDSLGRMNAHQGRLCWDTSAEARAALARGGV